MKFAALIVSAVMIAAVFAGCIQNDSANDEKSSKPQEQVQAENKTLADKWAIFMIDNASFSSDYGFMAMWKNYTRDVCGFPEEHMIFISDEENYTKANTVAALKWMVANAGPNSTALFSFDGHGACGPGSGMRILASCLSIGGESLYDYEIGEIMKDWKCKRFLFLSEGCQNGFMCDDESTPVTGSNPGFIAPGRLIVSASCEATFAWSNDTGPLFHSCVYYGLLNNTADGWDATSNDATGPMGTKDGRASVEEAFWYGCNHVWPATDFVYNMEAQPKMNDGVDGDFFL
ncbi:MAG: hypothetical protein PHH26_07155 [Candidatus Thermoplasmatota archaeon]|nr:hypothetical protein [Candidatus Thermoplasmatota archaeon]